MTIVTAYRPTRNNRRIPMDETSVSPALAALLERERQLVADEAKHGMQLAMTQARLDEVRDLIARLNGDGRKRPGRPRKADTSPAKAEAEGDADGGSL